MRKHPPIPRSPQTLGERLAGEIQRMPAEGRRRGINLFARKIAQMGAPGGSFPSVKSYLDDEVVPPIEFIEAAAKLFGVRPAWLAFGDGRRTREEQTPSPMQADPPPGSGEASAGQDDGRDPEFWKDPVAFAEREIEELQGLEPWVGQALAGATIWLWRGYGKLGIGGSERTFLSICWDAVWFPLDQAEEALEQDGEVLVLDRGFLSSYAASILNSLAILGCHLATREAPSPGWTPPPGEEEEEEDAEA